MEREVLHVRGLTRRFGRRLAINALDLTVREGDIYGFLGPNGAGKTTAMRCILGLIRKDAGEVRLLGQTDLVRARRHVGAVVETPALHGWMSGRDNLRYSAAYLGLSGAEAARSIDWALDRVGLKERATDRAHTYSLGMKQRLAIARALLGTPRLLMLDEPTNGLDPRGMREVRDLIRSLALHDQITVFISSHLLSEVQAICNRVGIVQEGTLRAEGDVETLIAAHRLNPIDREVEVGGPEPDALRAALEAMEGVAVLSPVSSGRLRVRLRDQTPAELNRALITAGVAVDTLIPQGKNLEDVFLEVTREP